MSSVRIENPAAHVGPQPSERARFLRPWRPRRGFSPLPADGGPGVRTYANFRRLGEWPFHRL